MRDLLPPTPAYGIRRSWLPDAVRSPCVLIVDDDPDAALLLSRSLQRHHIRTEVAGSYLEAKRAMARYPIEVVVCDVWMPDGETHSRAGIALLRELREQGSNTAVVLVTGTPELTVASVALELEATAYLPKPVEPDALVGAVRRGQRRVRERADGNTIAQRFLAEKELASRCRHNAALDGALGSLWMAYQPIVDSRTGDVAGHEALVRSHSRDLPHPGALFDCAERTERRTELNRAILGQVCRDLPSLVGDVFINLHPDDLLSPELTSPTFGLVHQATRCVLEVTEMSRLDAPGGAQQHLRNLRSLGYRIAIDDLGAGFSALSRLAALEPDVVKIDMSLIRNINALPRLQRVVGAIVSLCEPEGVALVAEGIETEAELECVADLGCSHAQGFFLGRPAPLAEVSS